MTNLLELSKRQILVISTGAVAVGIAGLLTVGMVMAAQMESASVKYPDISNTPADKVNLTKTADTLDNEDAPSKPQRSNTPATQPSAPVAAQQPAKTNTPAASKPGVVSGTVDTVQGVVNDVTSGHIPFTNLPVVPGDPLSYVGTVGQCPFYEIAGDKGCWPPKDISCNADWSICTYIGL